MQCFKTWFYIFVINFSFFTLVSCDECKIVRCNDPYLSAFCLQTKRPLAESCTSWFWRIKEQGFAYNQKIKLLLFHNNYRLFNINAFNSKELKWDNDLEEMAQRWAEQCPDDNITDNCTSLYKFNSTVYQNVYAETKIAETTLDLSNVVKTWFERDNQMISTSVRLNHMNRIGCGLVLKYRLIPGAGFFHRSHHETIIIETKKHIVCNYVRQ